MLIDHFGNIDQDKNGKRSIKCSLNLVLFGWLSKAWMIQINLEWKENLMDPETAETIRSNEVIFTFQFKTRDNKEDKNDQNVPLYRQYWEK